MSDRNYRNRSTSYGRAKSKESRPYRSEVKQKPSTETRSRSKKRTQYQEPGLISDHSTWNIPILVKHNIQKPIAQFFSAVFIGDGYNNPISTTNIAFGHLLSTNPVFRKDVDFLRRMYDSPDNDIKEHESEINRVLKQARTELETETRNVVQQLNTNPDDSFDVGYDPGTEDDISKYYDMFHDNPQRKLTVTNKARRQQILNNSVLDTSRDDSSSLASAAIARNTSPVLRTSDNVKNVRFKPADDSIISGIDMGPTGSTLFNSTFNDNNVPSINIGYVVPSVISSIISNDPNAAGVDIAGIQQTIDTVPVTQAIKDTQNTIVSDTLRQLQSKRVMGQELGVSTDIDDMAPGSENIPNYKKRGAETKAADEQAKKQYMNDNFIDPEVDPKKFFSPSTVETQKKRSQYAPTQASKQQSTITNENAVESISNKVKEGQVDTIVSSVIQNNPSTNLNTTTSTDLNSTIKSEMSENSFLRHANEDELYYPLYRIIGDRRRAEAHSKQLQSQLAEDQTPLYDKFKDEVNHAAIRNRQHWKDIYFEFTNAKTYGQDYGAIKWFAYFLTGMSSRVPEMRHTRDRVIRLVEIYGQSPSTFPSLNTILEPAGIAVMNVVLNILGLNNVNSTQSIQERNTELYVTDLTVPGALAVVDRGISTSIAKSDPVLLIITKQMQELQQKIQDIPQPNIPALPSNIATIDQVQSAVSNTIKEIVNQTDTKVGQIINALKSSEVNLSAAQLGIITQSLKEMLEKAVATMEQVYGDVFSKHRATVDDAIGKLVQNYANSISTLTQNVDKNVKSIVDETKNELASINQTLQNGITLGGASAQLMADINHMIKNIGHIQIDIGNRVDGVGAETQSLATGLSTILANQKTAISTINDVNNQLLAISADAKKAADKPYDAVIDKLANTVNQQSAQINALISTVDEVKSVNSRLTDTVSGLQSELTGVRSSITNTISGATNDIINAINPARNDRVASNSETAQKQLAQLVRAHDIMIDRLDDMKERQLTFNNIADLNREIKDELLKVFKSSSDKNNEELKKQSDSIKQQLNNMTIPQQSSISSGPNNTVSTLPGLSTIDVEAIQARLEQIISARTNAFTDTVGQNYIQQQNLYSQYLHEYRNINNTFIQSLPNAQVFQSIISALQKLLETGEIRNRQDKAVIEGLAANMIQVQNNFFTKLGEYNRMIDDTAKSLRMVTTTNAGVSTLTDVETRSIIKSSDEIQKTVTSMAASLTDQIGFFNTWKTELSGFINNEFPKFTDSVIKAVRDLNGNIQYQVPQELLDTLSGAVTRAIQNLPAPNINVTPPAVNVDPPLVNVQPTPVNVQIDLTRIENLLQELKDRQLTETQYNTLVTTVRSRIDTATASSDPPLPPNRDDPMRFITPILNDIKNALIKRTQVEQVVPTANTVPPQDYAALTDAIKRLTDAAIVLTNTANALPVQGMADAVNNLTNAAQALPLQGMTTAANALAAASQALPRELETSTRAFNDAFRRVPQHHIESRIDTISDNTLVPIHRPALNPQPTDSTISEASDIIDRNRNGNIMSASELEGLLACIICQELQTDCMVLGCCNNLICKTCMAQHQRTEFGHSCPACRNQYWPTKVKPSPIVAKATEAALNFIKGKPYTVQNRGMQTIADVFTNNIPKIPNYTDILNGVLANMNVQMETMDQIRYAVQNEIPVAILTAAANGPPPTIDTTPLIATFQDLQEKLFRAMERMADDRDVALERILNRIPEPAIQHIPRAMNDENIMEYVNNPHNFIEQGEIYDDLDDNETVQSLSTANTVSSQRVMPRRMQRIRQNDEPDDDPMEGSDNEEAVVPQPKQPEEKKKKFLKKKPFIQPPPKLRLHGDLIPKYLVHCCFIHAVDLATNNTRHSAAHALPGFNYIVDVLSSQPYGRDVTSLSPLAILEHAFHDQINIKQMSNNGRIFRNLYTLNANPYLSGLRNDPATQINFTPALKRTFSSNYRNFAYNYAINNTLSNKQYSYLELINTLGYHSITEQADAMAHLQSLRDMINVFNDKTLSGEVSMEMGDLIEARLSMAYLNVDDYKMNYYSKKLNDTELANNQESMMDWFRLWFADDSQREYIVNQFENYLKNRIQKFNIRDSLKFPGQPLHAQVLTNILGELFETDVIPTNIFDYIDPESMVDFVANPKKYFLKLNANTEKLLSDPTLPAEEYQIIMNLAQQLNRIQNTPGAAVNFANVLSDTVNQLVLQNTMFSTGITWRDMKKISTSQSIYSFYNQSLQAAQLNYLVPPNETAPNLYLLDTPINNHKESNVMYPSDILSNTTKPYGNIPRTQIPHLKLFEIHSRVRNSAREKYLNKLKELFGNGYKAMKDKALIILNQSDAGKQFNMVHTRGWQIINPSNRHLYIGTQLHNDPYLAAEFYDNFVSKYAKTLPPAIVNEDIRRLFDLGIIVNGNQTIDQFKGLIEMHKQMEDMLGYGLTTKFVGSLYYSTLIDAIAKSKAELSEQQYTILQTMLKRKITFFPVKENIHFLKELQLKAPLNEPTMHFNEIFDVDIKELNEVIIQTMLQHDYIKYIQNKNFMAQLEKKSNKENYGSKLKLTLEGILSKFTDYFGEECNIVDKAVLCKQILAYFKRTKVTNFSNLPNKIYFKARCRAFYRLQLILLLQVKNYVEHILNYNISSKSNQLLNPNNIDDDSRQFRNALFEALNLSTTLSIHECYLHLIKRLAVVTAAIRHFKHYTFVQDAISMVRRRDYSNITSPLFLAIDHLLSHSGDPTIIANINSDVYIIKHHLINNTSMTELNYLCIPSTSKNLLSLLEFSYDEAHNFRQRHNRIMLPSFATTNSFSGYTASSTNVQTWHNNPMYIYFSIDF